MSRTVHVRTIPTRMGHIKRKTMLGIFFLPCESFARGLHFDTKVDRRSGRRQRLAGLHRKARLRAEDDVNLKGCRPVLQPFVRCIPAIGSPPALTIKREVAAVEEISHPNLGARLLPEPGERPCQQPAWLAHRHPSTASSRKWLLLFRPHGRRRSADLAQAVDFPALEFAFKVHHHPEIMAGCRLSASVRAARTPVMTSAPTRRQA